MLSIFRCLDSVGGFWKVEILDEFDPSVPFYCGLTFLMTELTTEIRPESRLRRCFLFFASQSGITEEISLDSP
jgi:hypothetical protein